VFYELSITQIKTGVMLSICLIFQPKPARYAYKKVFGGIAIERHWFRPLKSLQWTVLFFNENLAFKLL